MTMTKLLDLNMNKNLTRTNLIHMSDGEDLTMNLNKPED